MSGRLRVDLAALQSNYQTYVCAGQGREVGAVVKADAYGLGCIEVSRALAAVGAQRFFVATPEEGLQLRESLVEARIYVFEGVSVHSAQALAAARLIPVINDHQQLAAWQKFSELPIAVQVDTGMSRLGFAMDISASDFSGFQIDLLISHFACADEVDSPLNALQIERFAQVARRFPAVKTSLGNSAAWLAGEAHRGDVGRAGIGLYGAQPFSGEPQVALETVARFEAPVIQTRAVAAGDSIGYGASVTASQPMSLATVACGYADGIPRLLSNRGALVWQNQRCPIVGRVSMDMTMVDVTDCAIAPEAGDWLECFGDQLSVDEVAAMAQTISYEIFTGIRPRVERQYHWG